MSRSLFKTAEDVWNGVFILVFLVLFGVLVFCLNLRGGALYQIAPFDFLLLSLAAFRMIRFMTYDKITHFIRVYFRSQKHAFGQTIFELLICPWCSGIWATLFIITIFNIFPFGRLFILLLAIAGLASSFQIFVKNFSHSGENSSPKEKDKNANTENVGPF